MQRELHPVFEVCVQFSSLENVDLYQRGYYQIRCRLKPPSKAADSKVSIRIPRSKASNLFPASVVEGQAVGETLEILYAEERINLDDLVIFTTKLPMRADKLPKYFEFKLVLELWFIEKEKILEKTGDDILCAFRCISRRELNLKLSPTRGLHCHRPLCFDYFHLAAVSMTIRGSLISLEPKLSTSVSSSRLDVLSKPKFDTEKLRTYHESMCRLLLSAYEALQLHIHTYSRFMPLKFQLRLQVVDTKLKLDALCRRYEADDDGMKVLEEDRMLLSQELTVLWKQLIELFQLQKSVDSQLAAEFHLERVKRFAEYFFLEENTMHCLLNSLVSPSAQPMRLHNRVAEALKKSSYLSTLPDLSVFCQEIDGSSATLPIIFEEKYSASPSRVASRVHSTNSEKSTASTSNLIPISPKRISNKLKAHLCLDLNYRNKPAETDSNGVLSGKRGKAKKLDSHSHRRRSSSAGRLIDKILSRFDPSPYETKFYSLTDETNQPRSSSSTHSNTPPQTILPRFISYSEPNLCLDRLFSLHEALLEPVLTVGANPRCRSEDNLALSFGAEGSDVVENVSRKVSPNIVNSPIKGNALCCLPLCQDNNPAVIMNMTSTERKESKEEDSTLSNSPQARLNTQLTCVIDSSVVEFVQNKETFKQKLSLLGYNGYLCSDFMRLASGIPYLGGTQPRSSEDGRVHLIICVHGLDGCSSDLRPYKTYLRLGMSDQHLDFLMSQSNENSTFSEFEVMSHNLVDEILLHLSQISTTPYKISFIAHSLGVLVVRSALADPRLESIKRKLHCFLSLNGPHCGVMFSPGAVNLGISFVQWWKKSESLQQLAFNDRNANNYEQSFLYKLSNNQSLSLFRYVLLVGSHQDMYVPCHSALIQPSPASARDTSYLGRAYEQMVHNLVNSIAGSERGTCFVRYTVMHGLSGMSRTHRVLGRAAHIAVLDDDVFIDKLLSVSALNYFK